MMMLFTAPNGSCEPGSWLVANHALESRSLLPEDFSTARLNRVQFKFLRIAPIMLSNTAFLGHTMASKLRACDECDPGRAGLRSGEEPRLGMIPQGTIPFSAECML